MANDQIDDRSKPESIRFVLRRATRPEHEALDDHPAFAALMGGALDLDGYGRLMQLFHGFYALRDGMVAQACKNHALERAGFVYAPRTAILAQDLAELGIRPKPVASAPSLPPIGSAGVLGGMLYVFEGSMLGGGVLCRAVETLLEKHGASGSGYWRWCRDAGGKRWGMTCGMLDQIGSSDMARTDMIGGARAAFLAFSDGLAAWQQPSPERSIERC